MSKKITIWVVLVAIVCCMSLTGASAQQDPSNAVFSPGLNSVFSQDTGYQLNVSFVPESFASARKSAVSVLRALFSDAQFMYSEAAGVSQLDIVFKDQTVAAMRTQSDEAGTLLETDLLSSSLRAGDVQAIYEALGLDVLPSELPQTSRLLMNDVDLPAAMQRSGEVTLGQTELDLLLSQLSITASVKVTAPIRVTWVCDDSGALKSLDIDGALALQGREAAVAEVSVRKTSSKLTIEALWTESTATKMAVSISIGQSQKAKTKSASAKNTTDARLVVSAKLDGYARYLKATCKLANTWGRAQDDMLSEQVNATVNVVYTDRSPEAEAANLSDISIQSKSKGKVSSLGDAASAIMNTDILVKRSDATVLKGVLSYSASSLTAAQAEKLTAGSAGAADEDASDVCDVSQLTDTQIIALRDDLNDGTIRMMQKIYPLLDASTQTLITGN